MHKTHGYGSSKRSLPKYVKKGLVLSFRVAPRSVAACSSLRATVSHKAFYLILIGPVILSSDLQYRQGEKCTPREWNHDERIIIIEAKKKNMIQLSTISEENRPHDFPRLKHQSTDHRISSAREEGSMKYPIPF